MLMYLGHANTTPVITIACNRAEGLLCSKVHVRTAAALMRHVAVLQSGYKRFFDHGRWLVVHLAWFHSRFGVTTLCSPVCGALQACTICLSPYKWSLAQHRILSNHFGDDLRSLHWNCLISVFPLPSRHKVGTNRSFACRIGLKSLL